MRQEICRSSLARPRPHRDEETRRETQRFHDQLFDYWSHIVPKRPPYAILCNFDEFWIYDFNTQLFDPVDRIALPKVAFPMLCHSVGMVWRAEYDHECNRLHHSRSHDAVIHVYDDVGNVI